jgi:hypothetical protein
MPVENGDSILIGINVPFSCIAAGISAADISGVRHDDEIGSRDTVCGLVRGIMPAGPRLG